MENQMHRERCGMPPIQRNLFDKEPWSLWPEGFRYVEEAIAQADEAELLREIPSLPFREFQFHGFEGKRRVVSFGWRYDYDKEKPVPADPIPGFLQDVLAKVVGTTGFRFGQGQQVLVTEYSPGSPIGWHKDKPHFGQVIGLSLLSQCRFRFRRLVEKKWERVSLSLAPRSAYIMEGPARWEWEHSIPPVEALRYSITFRNLRI